MFQLTINCVMFTALLIGGLPLLGIQNDFKTKMDRTNMQVRPQFRRKEWYFEPKYKRWNRREQKTRVEKRNLSAEKYRLASFLWESRQPVDQSGSAERVRDHADIYVQVRFLNSISELEVLSFISFHFLPSLYFSHSPLSDAPSFLLILCGIEERESKEWNGFSQIDVFISIMFFFILAIESTHFLPFLPSFVHPLLSRAINTISHIP